VAIFFSVGDAILMTVDSSGADPKVLEIRPKQDMCYIEGYITQWDGSVGRITNIISTGESATFSINVCEVNYFPHHGDKVSAALVENRSVSECGNFHLKPGILIKSLLLEGVMWRAVQVVMLEIAAVDGIHDPEVHDLLRPSDDFSITSHQNCGSIPLGEKGMAMVCFSKFK
jgi:hypothetical protein